MKKYIYSYTTTIEFSRPVTEHSFVLRCLPSSRDAQEVWASVELDPAVPGSLQRDSFGNTLVLGYIPQKHDHFTYHSFGTVVVGSEGGMVPNTIASIDPGALHSGLVPGSPKSLKDANDRAPHPVFRFPSPLTHADDAMRAFAKKAGIMPGTAGFLGAEEQRAGAVELMHLIHSELDYEPGSTTVATTAAEAFAQGRGVCQDFTHIMIAILREWGLPARYASGFTVGCGTTHAWAQAYVDDAWLGFDPTRNKEAVEDYVVCSVGRDWSDCPIERGTFVGDADQTQTVFMRMEEE